jgi:uncharacterized protein YyaL (SSP411 family)
VDDAAIDWTTEVVLAGIASGDPLDARGLTFLLRCAVDRPDVRDALEPALARALEQVATIDAATQGASWLILFADAAALTDDERIAQASADLVESLRRSWGGNTSVESAAFSVDACLSSSHLPFMRAAVSDAIDELERVVGGAYEPGEGVPSRLQDWSGPRGRLVDHVRLSSALLTAFDVTGRLPYSMLAEELVQLIRRTIWDEPVGLFRASPADAGHPFVPNCDAARVLLRIAALHGQEAYRQAAVLAVEADYARDANRILTALSSTYRRQGAASAAYGLALFEGLAIQ